MAPSQVLRFALAGIAASVLQAQAPNGYRLYDNKLTGLKFYYPPAYKQIPLPPTERILRARFVRTRPPKVFQKYRGRNPEIFVFAFEEVPPPTGVPQPAKTRPPGEKGKEKVRQGGARLMTTEQRNRVRTFAEFKAKRLAGFEIVPAGKDDHYELTPPRHRLVGRKPWSSGNDRPTDPVGYLIVKRQRSWVLGVFGLSVRLGATQLASEVTKMSWALKIVDNTGSTHRAEARLERSLHGKKLRALEKRMAVRRRLARGWKVVDTPNYIIVHHSKSPSLISRIARNIEAVRALYERAFPPVRPVDAVSIVRVCRTLDEYHKYGGPRGSGGFWHSGNEELVLFDYSQTMRKLDAKQARRLGRRLTDKDSLLVLYHEALHQYVYYAIGEFRPHDWFNEGYGDYFSGAVIPSGARRVSRIGPARWRIHRAKDQCELNLGAVKLEKLLRAERAEFYSPRRRADYYAAAWSFIFFLKNDKSVQNNPAWAGLLQDYFTQLKDAHAAEIAQVDGEPTRADKEKAGFKARRSAIDQALAGISLPELEAAWRSHVVKMKDPWKSQREKRRKARR